MHTSGCEEGKQPQRQAGGQAGGQADETSCRTSDTGRATGLLLPPLAKEYRERERCHRERGRDCKEKERGGWERQSGGQWAHFALSSLLPLQVFTQSGKSSRRGRTAHTVASRAPSCRQAPARLRPGHPTRGQQTSPRARQRLGHPLPGQGQQQRPEAMAQRVRKRRLGLYHPFSSHCSSWECREGS